MYTYTTGQYMSGKSVAFKASLDDKVVVRTPTAGELSTSLTNSSYFAPSRADTPYDPCDISLAEIGTIHGEEDIACLQRCVCRPVLFLLECCLHAARKLAPSSGDQVQKQSTVRYNRVNTNEFSL